MNTLSPLKIAGCALVLACQSAPVLAQSTGWRNQVAALVKANFSYPRSAIVRGDEGRAVVRLAVAGDGSVTKVTLSESSGSAILDREAMRIVGKLGRLPSPPRGVSSVDLPIRWTLN